MPGRVKLLNNAFGTVTGTPYRIETAKPPYTIHIRGGFTGTINILTAASTGPTSSALVDTPTGTFMADFGEVGGSGAVATEVKTLTGLTDQTVVNIRHYVSAIRADAVGVTVAGATVELEFLS